VAAKKHYLADMQEAQGFFCSRMAGEGLWLSASLTSSYFTPDVNVAPGNHVSPELIPGRLSSYPSNPPSLAENWFQHLIGAASTRRYHGQLEFLQR
jgi:hypothetical protein